jgi:hypothetical protein
MRWSARVVMLLWKSWGVSAMTTPSIPSKSKPSAAPPAVTVALTLPAPTNALTTDSLQWGASFSIEILT